MARSDGSVIIDTRLNTAGFGKGVNSIKSQFAKMGAAVSKVGGAITTVFTQSGKYVTKLGTSVAKLGGSITSAFTRGGKSAQSFNAQLGSIGTMAKKVGTLVAAVFSVRAIIDFSKEALELGSDLQEVQNVVDVTFTTMNDRVNEFAKNAASTAGLSETMAKRYTGTFGAMAKSFQFTEEEAFNMSTALTQLAGDVASFYNITQDEAYTKLKSVFTGETETLKDLGVVMTQTALDDFALRKGLGKTTSQMTEQEKVALRYQFVLEQLSAASGDFIRTQDGWANQTRILSLQFEQLRATIGQGLINALTPAVKSLNLLIAKFQEAAEAFRDLTETIFGSAEDANNAIGDITNGVGEMGDAAEEAAKQAKKALAPFDEIVKISAEAEAEDPSVTIPGTGENPSGGTVTPDVEVGDVGKTIIDKILESIKAGDWVSVGTLISQELTNSLNSINWEDAAAKVAAGAKSVTDALNGLTLSPDAFSSIGATIANVANTITTALQGLADGVDWGKIEEGFSSGMLSFSVEIDTSGIVDSVTSLISGAISTIDFSVVGTSLANALNDALAGADWSKVGTTIAQVLLETPQTVAGLIQGLNWEAVGKAVSDTLNTALVTSTAWARETDWLKIGESISTFVEKTQWGTIAGNFFALISTAFGNIDFSQVGATVGTAFNNTMAGLDWSAFGTFIGEVLLALPQTIIGFISTANWESVGTSLSNFLNSMLTTATAWIAGVDWVKIGASIDAFISKTDWGQITTNFFNLVDTAFGAIDFSSVGASVATALNSAISGANWAQIGTTIGEALLAVPQSVVGFAQQLDWSKTGKAVSDTLNAALVTATDWVRSTDWVKLGESIKGFITTTDWGGIANNFFTLLFTAFSAINFTSIGANIGTSLNGVIAAVNWNDVGATIGTALMAWPDVLVGFIQKTDWEKVGTSLSELIIGSLDYIAEWVKTTDFLAIGESISSFIEATDWSKIGSKLFEVFTTAVENVQLSDQVKILVDTLNSEVQKSDWGTVGPSISDLFNETLQSLNIVLDEFDWGSLTRGLTMELNGVISGISWALLGTSVSQGASTLLSGFNAAVSDFDWAALGDGIADGINQVDWVSITGDLTSGVNNLITGVMDLFSNFFHAMDWVKLGKDLWNSLIEMIAGIDYAGIVSKAFELAGAAIGSAIGLAGGLIVGLFDTIKAGWENAVSYFDEFIDEAGGNVAKGLLDGILNGLLNIGKWVMDNIFLPFFEGLNAAFEIASPSKAMEERGEFISEGLLNGIKSWFAGISTWVKTNLWEPFKKAFEDTFSGLKDKMESIMNGVKNVMKTPINGIIGFINSMVKAVCDGINMVIDALNEISVELPDEWWMPKDMRGAKIGFDIDRITAPTIPYLAQGAVIPPNAPFMAVLGDQRHGTNIEAPLETIEQALENVLARRGSGMNDSQVIELLQAILEAILGIEIDGETLSNAITNYQRKMAVSTGGNA